MRTAKDVQREYLAETGQKIPLRFCRVILDQEAESRYQREQSGAEDEPVTVVVEKFVGDDPDAAYERWLETRFSDD